MKKLLLTLIIFLYVISPTSAQNPTGFRVTRVSGCSEISADFYGVDYPTAATYARPAGGFLSLKNAEGIEIAIWAPGQWSRIEKLN